MGVLNADFISCVAFGKSAEFAEKYLHQGVKIAVSDRIQTGSDTNREGNKVFATDVVIEEQEFAESKASGTGNSNGYQNGAGNGGFSRLPYGTDEGLPFL